MSTQHNAFMCVCVIGTKIYFETKLFCRFIDINNEYWGIKFETQIDSQSFQRHIRVRAFLKPNTVLNSNYIYLFRHQLKNFHQHKIDWLIVVFHQEHLKMYLIKIFF